MRRILRHRPSPALVVACLALTVALGGTSYAAISLPRNSVGTPQLKRNAVNSSKVRNFSLLRADFKRGQIPAGPRGRVGATGPAGPAGATGATGATGPQGPAGPLLATLPSGSTLRGGWGIGNFTAGTGVAENPISYTFPLAASPTVRLQQPGGPISADCPGTLTNPQANPGFLCIYTRFLNGSATLSFYGLEGQNTYRFGVMIFAFSTGANTVEATGTWAVTAA